jgi:hypothetical protein
MKTVDTTTLRVKCIAPNVWRVTGGNDGEVWLAICATEGIAGGLIEYLQVNFKTLVLSGEVAERMWT